MDYLLSTNYWGGDVFWNEVNDEALMQSRKTFCGCPRDYKPVCSSKGKLAQTYDNLCLLTCSQRNSFDLLYSYEGPCCQRLQCKHGEMPLCDTKGNMYRDRCTFQYSQCVEWKTRNNALRVGTACPCTYKCPNLFRPVCDTAGNTYKNKCYFLREQCYSKMAYYCVILSFSISISSPLF
uniref:Kazal-like domain-containing protein n=1 Tax=Trichuris muris TaxID=70415 RepID=A0A5S6Q5D5_TRIMR